MELAILESYARVSWPGKNTEIKNGLGVKESKFSWNAKKCSSVQDPKGTLLSKFMLILSILFIYPVYPHKRTQVLESSK